MSITAGAIEQRQNKQKGMITKRYAVLLIRLIAVICCLLFGVNKPNESSLFAGVKFVSCLAENSDGLGEENAYRRQVNSFEPSEAAADLDALSAATYGLHLPPRRLVARSELFSGNVGLKTDGTDALRSLSNQFDDDDDGGNDDDAEALSAPSFSLLVDPSNQIDDDSIVGLANTALRNEIYLPEDKDYPKSLFEDYQRQVGQVSGITTLPSNDVAIFHRSNRHWTPTTFDESSKQISKQTAGAYGQLIENNTIMILDGEDGSSVASFGANLFYLPHSIASDRNGNLWVSDVARHQVMRLPAASLATIIEQQSNGIKSSSNNDNSTSTTARAKTEIWPDIVLGEAFVPGTDQGHFCQPAEIAISANGLLVFVADGYCNGRVMVFTGTGTYLASFGEREQLSVVHSLTLFEERNLLCVADRENRRILCYKAGLDGDLMSMGELVVQIDYPLGRVFAITSLSEDHLLVSSQQLDTSRYDLAILNPFTNALKIVWMSSDLLEPHSLTTTSDRQAAYAADISEGAYKKVFKFNIIRRKT